MTRRAAPDDGDAVRPMRPIVASTVLYAAYLVVLALAAATAADRRGLALALVLVDVLIGWGVAALIEGFTGLWNQQVEDARTRPTAVVEPRLRTVLVVAVLTIVVGAVLLPIGLLFGDMAVVSNAFGAIAGGYAYGAWRLSRWERQAGRLLLGSTRWQFRGRRPLVAVPMAAVTPATGAG